MTGMDCGGISWWEWEYMVEPNMLPCGGKSKERQGVRPHYALQSTHPACLP